MKRLAVILAVLVFANSALADATTGRVTRIYPNADGRVYFWLEGDTCKTNKYWYFVLGGDNTKAWYSLLLAAATNEKEVTISHNACIPTQHQVISYVFQDF